MVRIETAIKPIHLFLKMEKVFSGDYKRGSENRGRTKPERRGRMAKRRVLNADSGAKQGSRWAHQNWYVPLFPPIAVAGQDAGRTGKFSF